MGLLSREVRVRVRFLTGFITCALRSSCLFLSTCFPLVMRRRLERHRRTSASRGRDSVSHSVKKKTVSWDLKRDPSPSSDFYCLVGPWTRLCLCGPQLPHL